MMTGSISLVGAGLAVLGAGIGMGILAGKAVEAIARQPAETRKIQVTMLIGAALIEGIALFALVLALIK